MNDIVRELDPEIDERPDHPFPFLTGPFKPPIFWRHREFVRRLEVATAEPLEPLWADVTGLQLVADVLEDAFERNGAKPRRRASTNADHSARTEAAKTYLASRMMERRIERAKQLLVDDKLSLVEISLRTGFKSQSHFTTLFRKFTNVTPKAWRDLKLA